MSTTVFPESGDQITEASWTALNEAMTVAERYRLTGFTLSAGTGLNANVAGGTAMVNGYVIVSDATQAVAVTASQTNYIWLAEDGTLSHNTTGTNPGTDLLLGTAVTDGSGVTSVSHQYNIANSLNALVVKPSDETVNNSTTYQDDDDFTFAVSDGEQWEIRLLLLVDNPDAAADIKLQWNVSGGSITQANYLLANNGSGSMISSAGSSVSANFGAVGTDLPLVIHSYVFVTTGGTLALQWAQNSAFAGNTVVAQNSIMFARRVLG